MHFPKQLVVLLGLASCVLFAGLSVTQAELEKFSSVTVDIKEDQEEEEEEEEQLTQVTIKLHGAIPNHFYTVWIRLRDPDGPGPGKANPLTNTNSTPLAPTWAIEDLLRETDLKDLKLTLTGDLDLPGGPVPLPLDHCSVDPSNPSAPHCPGTRDVINGFLTNAEGNGKLTVTLDFLLSDGVYPFDGYDMHFDPAQITRVLDEAGGTLRISSHLTDNVGHGLVPGTHELAFDYVLP